MRAILGKTLIKGVRWLHCVVFHLEMRKELGLYLFMCGLTPPNKEQVIARHVASEEQDYTTEDHQDVGEHNLDGFVSTAHCCSLAKLAQPEESTQ